MIRFHSRVVRVTEMANKWVVNFKEKLVDSSDPTKPEVDEDNVEIFDLAEVAQNAIDTFMAGQ